MAVLTRGLAARIAAVATALVVGPATLAPGTAEAPTPPRAALAGDGGTAAQTYHWRTMLWDFAWEFGESLDSPPYRGTDIKDGRWEESTDGTGRVVKYGGGIEFHSGDKRFDRVGPDKGTTTLTLREQPAKRGRWEIRERAERFETNGANYRFLIELIPDDPAGYDCGAHNLTIAEVQPGASSVKIGVNAGTSRWTRSFTGYPQRNDNYSFAVQVTASRITWFINGKAVAGLSESAAIPQVPMTVRLSLVGAGTREMNKSIVKLDWVRSYNLLKGDPARTSGKLDKGRYGGC